MKNLRMILLMTLLLLVVMDNKVLAGSPPPNSPVIDYRFDDPADFANGVVKNYASPNYFGVIYGSRAYAPGVSGLSWEGNNIDNFTIVPGSELIDSSENSFTAEAFFMRYSNIGEDGIIDGWDKFIITIFASGEGSFIRFAMAFTDNTGGELDYSFPDLSYLNQWMRVTTTFSKNKSGSTAKIYLNGNLVAERFFPGKFLRQDNIYSIGIGANREWARFHGRIDDVKVWTKELTKGQIANR